MSKMTSTSNNPAVNKSLIDPASMLTSLSAKLQVALLFLTASMVFYQMSLIHGSIPDLYSRIIAISLIILACFSIVLSLNDYYYISNKMIIYCDQNENSCLYNKKELSNVLLYYYLLIVFYLLCNIAIAFLIIKYKKINKK
jgi:hypothetical protein